MSGHHHLPAFGHSKTKAPSTKDLIEESATSTTQSNSEQEITPNNVRSESQSSYMNHEAVFRSKDSSEAGAPSSEVVPISEDSPPAKKGFLSWPWFRAKRQKPVKAPVQGELSLESVHPVRNDLSESDLEVILKAKTNPSNPFLGRAPRNDGPKTASPAPGELWGRITARFFK
jgi:hypothetical protein